MFSSMVATSVFVLSNTLVLAQPVFEACVQLAGLLGLIPLGRIPEPGMAPSTHRPLRDVLRAPFRHPEFRALVAFLAEWTFAINLSARNIADRPGAPSS